MLRSTQYERFPWEFRTQSQIRDDLLEACTRRLSELPGLNVLDPSLSSADASALYRISHTALEHPLLPEPDSADQLAQMVLAGVEEELCLLSPDEYALLGRLVSGLGETAIYSRDELPAAEMLARRLWLYITMPEDGTVHLHMDIKLVSLFHACFQSAMSARCHARMEEFQEQTNYVLMYQGMLPAPQALHMLQIMLTPEFTRREDLCRRALLSMYDHAYAPDMELMLLHPGLAVPRLLMDRRDVLSPEPYDAITYPYAQFTDTESMVAERLAGLVHSALRQEKDGTQVLTDICILAKQGAGAEDMIRALAASLVIGPTPDMIACVRELHAVIQPWPIAAAAAGGGTWP